MSEFTTARDLSRAHWQRSVGNVVMGRAFEEVILSQQIDTDVASIEKQGLYVDQIDSLFDTGQVWARAYVYSTRALRPARQPLPLPQDLEAGVRRHTFHGETYGETHSVLEEGIRTQQVFPINLARIVHRHAVTQNANNFIVNDIEDVVKMLRRTDFHDLVLRSAMTRNGVWGNFATSIQAEYFPPVPSAPMLGFEFGDNHVQFSSEFQGYLSDQLRSVNKEGRSSKVAVNYRTSSGCPVRHRRPRFAGSTQDRERLESLGNHFGESEDELLETRERTVIEEALLRVAQVIEIDNRRCKNSASVQPQAAYNSSQEDFI